MREINYTGSEDGARGQAVHLILCFIGLWTLWNKIPNYVCRDGRMYLQSIPLRSLAGTSEPLSPRCPVEDLLEEEMGSFIRHELGKQLRHVKQVTFPTRP